MRIASLLLALLLCRLAGGEWYQYQPAGSVDGQGILRDVVSRCTAEGRRVAYEEDQVTYCHEATHSVNSRIRNSLGGHRNAFYVGGGRAVVLVEPKVQLRTVVKYVKQHRNSTYQLYFIDQQQYWQDEPLYILDEWTAYVNGSQAARELKADPHGTHELAQWFCHYADCVVQAVKEHDPQYAELADLVAFVDWQKARTAEVAGESTAPVRAEAVAPITAQIGSSVLIDLDPKYRQRNHNKFACVRCSVVHLMRIVGLWDKADEFWSRYADIPRGENPGPLAAKLDSVGVQYEMTTRGDEQLLEDALVTGRGAGVTWGGAHMVNLVGRSNGNAILMGNQVIDRNHEEPWDEFLNNWRRSGGWAVVITSGNPGEPVSE